LDSINIIRRTVLNMRFLRCWLNQCRMAVREIPLKEFNFITSLCSHEQISRVADFLKIAAGQAIRASPANKPSTRHNSSGMNIIIPINRKGVPHVFIICSLLAGYLLYYAYKRLRGSDEEVPLNLIYTVIVLIRMHSI
jgi:hypothetical protein